MSFALPWFLLAVVGALSFILTRPDPTADGIAAQLLAEAKLEAESKTVNVAVLPDAARARRIAWVIGGSIFVAIRLAMGSSFGIGQLPFALLGAVGGELYCRRKKEIAAKEATKRLEFYLPTAMERVVMAVGSGLDIIPALAEAARKSSDPVSGVFRRIVSLSEGGLPVEQALKIVSGEVPSSSVKHALVHLGLAYKQGGEVVRPLKELSDATQLQYQENIEEEIAKLPVKAVIPLVLTFAGLIICFLTVPLVQVGSITKQVANATK